MDNAMQTTIPQGTAVLASTKVTAKVARVRDIVGFDEIEEFLRVSNARQSWSFGNEKVQVTLWKIKREAFGDGPEYPVIITEFRGNRKVGFEIFSPVVPDPTLDATVQDTINALCDAIGKDRFYATDPYAASEAALADADDEAKAVARK